MMFSTLHEAVLEGHMNALAYILEVACRINFKASRIISLACKEKITDTLLGSTSSDIFGLILIVKRHHSYFALFVAVIFYVILGHIGGAK